MKYRHQTGFTLIELIIVILIIGILAAISYPSYQEYVMRGNRTEAMALLNEAAARQERYFAQNNTYADTAAKLNITDYVAQLKYYTLAVANVTANTYTLTASAKSAPQTGDTKCANFVLNQTGAKSVSGTYTAANCWK